MVLVNSSGNPFPDPVQASTPGPAPAILRLDPIDDQTIWLEAPMYDPPLSADAIARCQREINDIYGTTRNAEPIIKLVWNGDRRYWHQLYMSWDAAGKPNTPVVRRPRVRYKALRDGFGRLERDVFPPRWLLLTRLEPEQYPRYQEESWVRDPGLGVKKCIRPDDPPPVYWLWFATIAAHNDHCCATEEANRCRCYGKYAPPEYAYDLIRAQKAADLKHNIKYSPYEQLDESMMRAIEAKNNGYEYEIQQLQMESEIFIENPWALIDPKLALKRNINTTPKARRLVKDFYDHKLQEAGKRKPDEL